MNDMKHNLISNFPDFSYSLNEGNSYKKNLGVLGPFDKWGYKMKSCCSEMGGDPDSNPIIVSDVSSEENWSISSDSSFSNKYRTPKESNRKDEYIFVGSTIKKFSPVIAGPYPATTERLLTRVSVAKTPIQQPVFEQEKRLQKPIIPLKPLNLLAKSSHPLRPTQNNSLPEITGVKIALTPAPTSISRREIPQTPSTLTRSRIIKGVAVASTTSLIQSNEKSRNH